MLRFIPLPPGVPEFLLLLVIVGAILFVARRVARRRAFARKEADVPLPALTTDLRVRGIVRKVYRDPQQGVWLMELSIARRRFVLCLTDASERLTEYQAMVGKEADIALFGLATLAPGGAEAIRDQITDIDSVDLSTNPVRLIPGGQFANDYVVIGRVLSHREEEMDGLRLIVYRMQVARSDELTLVLELAVELSPDFPPYPEDSMVHGSARLYGKAGV
ncbi:MAG: hypothetical protein SFU56_00110 [Capsulimonadales bacterium]|nr:hypothetical protein [Capsulimonadales bacterium]